MIKKLRHKVDCVRVFLILAFSILTLRLHSAILSTLSGTGYGILPDSIKNIFNAAYDFSKPLREVIEKVGEQYQDALKSLIRVGK